MAGGARDALMGTEPVNIPCYIEDSWRSDPWAPCDSLPSSVDMQLGESTTRGSQEQAFHCSEDETGTRPKEPQPRSCSALC